MKTLSWRKLHIMTIFNESDVSFIVRYTEFGEIVKEKESTMKEKVLICFGFFPLKSQKCTAFPTLTRNRVPLTTVGGILPQVEQSVISTK